MTRFTTHIYIVITLLKNTPWVLGSELLIKYKDNCLCLCSFITRKLFIFIVFSYAGLLINIDMFGILAQLYYYYNITDGIFLQEEKPNFQV